MGFDSASSWPSAVLFERFRGLRVLGVSVPELEGVVWERVLRISRGLLIGIAGDMSILHLLQNDLDDLSYVCAERCFRGLMRGSRINIRMVAKGLLLNWQRDSFRQPTTISMDSSVEAATDPFSDLPYDLFG